jgi:hypothetical protein
MEGWRVTPDLGDELKCTRYDDRHCGENMRDDNGIARGLAGDVPMRHEPVPAQPISTQDGATVEQGHRRDEDQLPRDCNHKPQTADPV